MTDWDRSDVFSLAPSMHPPRFMWLREDDTYDLKKEKDEIRKHYDRAVNILDGGEGYDTLKSMKERLEAHHTRAKQAESRYKSRRKYARLQFGLMKQKVTSIAQERIEGEDDQAVQKEANQILDEPMGSHWRAEDGQVVMSRGLDEVWVVTASGFNPDERWADGEIPISDVNIHFRPGRSDFAGEFDEDHLNSTDKRIFDGDETWREALDSIHKQWESFEEQHERAMNTRELLRFRAAVVKTVLYRFEAYGSVDEMEEAEAQEIAEETKSGRKSTLNAPDAHPEVMLRAVLEWTGDDANREKPFRSETKPSLCGHVSERLEEPAGYSVPQETIKSRLQSLMSELGVELPHGHTHKLSYFEAREEITEAMKEHDLV